MTRKSMNRPTPDKPDHGAYPRTTAAGYSIGFVRVPRHQAGGLQILQQNDRLTVADLPVSDHLQRPAKRQLQHLDGFIIHPAAAGGFAARRCTRR